MDLGWWGEGGGFDSYVTSYCTPLVSSQPDLPSSRRPAAAASQRIEVTHGNFGLIVIAAPAAAAVNTAGRATLTSGIPSLFFFHQKVAPKLGLHQIPSFFSLVILSSLSCLWYHSTASIAPMG